MRQEQDATQLFLSRFPTLGFIATDKRTSSLVDGFVTKRDVVTCAVETKCRTMSTEDLFGRFNAEMLVAYDKISNARELCFALKISLLLWFYLPTERTLLVQKVCDERGVFSTPVRLESLTTQATVNGGTKFTTNAFINVRNAVVIK